MQVNQLKPTYNADTREPKPRLRRASKTSGYTAPSQACEALEVLNLRSHPHAVRKPRQYDVTANQLATARDPSHHVRQDTPKTRQHDLVYVHADSPRSRREVHIAHIKSPVTQPRAKSARQDYADAGVNHANSWRHSFSSDSPISCWFGILYVSGCFLNR